MEQLLRNRRLRVVLLFVLGLTVGYLAAGCRVAAPPDETALPAEVADRVPDGWAFDLTAPAVTAPSGMVVSDASLAADVGRDVLMRGGNAVDAAVATAFVLAVVYPEAGNIGGGGFMVAHVDGTTAALDFRETAPQAATRDMYVTGEDDQSDASLVGHRAAGVPGSVAGLRAAWERFGTRPWAELVQRAISLAENGFTVDRRFAATVRRNAHLLDRFAGSRALFLSGGEPLEEGTTWRNSDLAATLRRIAERGRAGFYEGETADLIVEEMERGGGLITHDDLRSYEARWRVPVGFDYRGYRVYGMPPPSSGGITMALMAHILQAYDLHEAGWHSVGSLHLVTEAMRRAFAVRNHYLGDPDYVHIPRERLLSEAFATEQRASISADRATPSVEVTAGTGQGSRPAYHTTHFSVVDEEGNAVALTTTVNFLYGSKVTVDGAGFLLNNEMDDFAARPGKPNAFALVQGEANAIEPGKRMLSSMSPTIVLGEDLRPLLVTGARGGPRIISAAFQVLSNTIDYGFDISAAVRAPRIHHQHLPDTLFYERGGLTNVLVETLRARGHAVVERGGMIGNAPSILRDGDRWTAVGDPRNTGAAAGY